MKSALSFLLVLFISQAYSQNYWHLVESSTTHDLHCIDFVSESVGYIGGQEVLLKTTDGGASWVEVQIDSLNAWTENPWTISDLHFFDELHGRAVFVGYGSMAETMDGGATWTAMASASSGLCYFGSIYFSDADNGFVGGHGCFEGAIIDILDNGVWSTTLLPTEISDQNDLVSAIDFVDPLNGCAVTLGGHVFLTSDGGHVWDSIPLTSPDIFNAGPISLTDVRYRDAENVYATYTSANGFGILSSEDSGQTWDIDWETATFFYPNMFAAHFDGNGKGYFGGEYNNSVDTLGIIFDENPNFWSYQPIDEPIRDITSHSDSIAFLVGLNGAIYSSVDLGTLSLTDHNTQAFTLYPNPVSSELTIQLNDASDAIQEIWLVDSSGKRVEVRSPFNRSSAQVDLRIFPSGHYFVVCESHKGISKQKFIKE